MSSCVLVGCEINVNCSTSVGEGLIYVKATNAEGYSLSAEEVSVEQNVIRYPNTHMEQVFPVGMVDHHEGLVVRQVNISILNSGFRIFGYESEVHHRPVRPRTQRLKC